MAASDVYAVGVTALVLLTGIDPRSAAPGARDRRRGRAQGIAVPREVLRALEKMLDPDPDKRAKRVTGARERRRRQPAGGKKRTPGPAKRPISSTAWKRDATAENRSKSEIATARRGASFAKEPGLAATRSSSLRHSSAQPAARLAEVGRRARLFRMTLGSFAKLAPRRAVAISLLLLFSGGRGRASRRRRDRALRGDRAWRFLPPAGWSSRRSRAPVPVWRACRDRVEHLLERAEDLARHRRSLSAAATSIASPGAADSSGSIR